MDWSAWKWMYRSTSITLLCNVNYAVVLCADHNLQSTPSPSSGDVPSESMGRETTRPSRS